MFLNCVDNNRWCLPTVRFLANDGVLQLLTSNPRLTFILFTIKNHGWFDVAWMMVSVWRSCLYSETR